MMVAPERETPGIIARHWTTPTPAAVFAGIVSTLLGLYVLAALPAASLVLLGTLLAIELIVIGITLLSLGLALRKTGKF